MTKQRTVMAVEAAAHKPHGRKHRGRDVLLEVDSRPAWLRREREIYLAQTERLVEAMHVAVREPPKGIGGGGPPGGATPWVVPTPKPIRRKEQQEAKSNVLTQSDKRLLNRLLREAAMTANWRLAQRLLRVGEAAGVTAKGKTTLVDEAQFREEKNRTYGRGERAKDYAKIVRLLERHGAVPTPHVPFVGYLTAHQDHLAKRSLTDELMCDDEPWVKDAMKALRKAEAMKTE